MSKICIDFSYSNIPVGTLLMAMVTKIQNSSFSQENLLSPGAKQALYTTAHHAHNQEHDNVFTTKSIFLVENRNMALNHVSKSVIL